jgi:NAD(P)-dependent dehydrogenase (short-subunit alcohol dehydrogenase family)
MKALAGKVAVVVGGVSGSGAATVRRFIAEGARVVLGDIQDEAGSALEKELAPDLEYLHADACREADVERAVNVALGPTGRLDCMFNTAGAVHGIEKRIEEIDVDDFDAALTLLLRGVFLGMKHAARVMHAQQSGAIIDTARVSGLRAGYGPYPYATAKAGVIHLARCAAMELGESGVRVNSICPGGIATPLFGKALGVAHEQATEPVDALKGALAQLQPIPRAGSTRRCRRCRALARERAVELREWPRARRGRMPRRRPRVDAVSSPVGRRALELRRARVVSTLDARATCSARAPSRQRFATPGCDFEESTCSS